MAVQRLRLLPLALSYLHLASSVPTNSTYTVPSLQSSTVTSTGKSTGFGDYIIAGLEHETSTSTGSQTENDRSNVAPTSLTPSKSGTSTHDGLTESQNSGSLTSSSSTGSVKKTSSPSPSGDRNITADAYACHSAKASWWSYYLNPRNQSTTSYTYTTTSWNATVGTADVYTTSNGIPVARGNLTSTGQTWYTTSVSEEVSPTDTVQITRSSPTCTVPAHICTSWYESYMDALGLMLFKDVIPTSTIVPASILTNSPQCPQPMVQLDKDGNGVSTVGPSCSFWGGHVSVYYWNTWDTPSPSSGFAPAPTNASLPRVTTVGNITMTYPSVYLSLDQLTAWTEANVWSFSTTSLETISLYQHQVGNTYRDILISMDPAEVSSLRYVPLDHSAFMNSITASGIYNLDLISRSQTPDMSYMGWIGTPRAMDYEHITAPSPEDYFLNPNMPPNCDWGSRNDMCGTIYEGDYRPQLSLPSKLIDLDPAWKNCEPHINGIYDPPKALQPATTLDGPQFASLLPTTTSAKQASSVVAPTPTPTSPLPKTDPTSATEDPASDKTSTQGQTTVQEKPTQNTAVPDGPNSPSTVKETGGPAPISDGRQSNQDSDDPITSAPSSGGEVSPITTDSPASTPDQTSTTNPGTAADAEPSSSPNDDPPKTSPATDPSASPSQNLAETSQEARTSSADEALSTAPENALSVLSAAQATYTSQDPATTEIHISASGANTVLTQTTIQTDATEGDHNSNPPISDQRALSIEVAGSTLPTTQLVNPTGATQVQVADTTLSVGGSPVSIGNGNQASAVPDGIVVVGGSDDGQTSTLLFPTSVQLGADAAAAQGGMEQSSSTAGQVSGSGVVVGGGSTLSVGGEAVSTAGQGFNSVSGETGVDGQAATSTILAGAVGAEASRSSQGEPAFIVSAAGATFTASPLGSGAVGLGDDNVLTYGGSDFVLGSATLSVGSAGIVIAGAEETSTVQFPGAEATTKAPAGVLVSLDSQTITASPTGSNGMVLGEGTTLLAGGPAVTVGQQSLSLESAGILVYGPDGTTTIPTSQHPTRTPDASSFLLTVGGQTIPASRLNPSALALPDSHTTLTLGGEAAVIADETISLDHSAIVLTSGTKTSSLPFAHHHQPSTSEVPVAVITALQTQYTIFPDPEHTDALVIDDHTLAPGSDPITLPNDQILSLGPSGLEVADATRTTTLDLPVGTTSSNREPQATITVDGSTLTAYAAGSSNTAAGAAVVVGVTTLSPGGDALSLGDGTVSLGPSGLVVAGGDQAMTTVPLTESTSSRSAGAQSTRSTSGTVTPSMSSEGGEAEESEGSEASATASSAAAGERCSALWTSGLFAGLVAFWIAI